MKLTKSAQNMVLRWRIELTQVAHGFEVVDRTDEVSDIYTVRRR
ncbi:chlorohydrolase [Streptococcus pneumoniae]|nr:chlorohydrolase [Streptococcus pneumoniae]